MGLNYFRERAQALALLMEAGFNKSVPTRLAFDTIVCRENVEEIPGLHRWARTNNVFVLFVNYLPSGRSTDPHHDAAFAGGAIRSVSRARTDRRA